VSSAETLEFLFRASQDGDERAFTQFVRLTQPTVWKVVASLGQSQNQEDLVQEIYLKVWRQRHTFRGESSLNAWVAGIARNTTIDHIRKSVRSRKLLNYLESSYVASEAVSELSPEYFDLLSATSTENSEAFMLTQFVGLSYEETADVLQCPVGTIRSRVARARSAFLHAYQASQKA
jgi:RNA polymerase sigma-70 factor (ECF subfamily)